MTLVLLDDDADVSCVRVASDIGQSFLHDAIQHGFHVGGQAFTPQPTSLEIDRQAEAAQGDRKMTLRNSRLEFR